LRLPGAKKSVNKGPREINLIPLMNLFVTMIPLLLLTAAFYHVGMVSVSVPGQTLGPPTPMSRDEVAVNVRLSGEGFTLTATNDALVDAELRRLDAVIPRRGARLDLDALRAALARIKRRYHESTTLVVLPAEETSYQELIDTMDAARHHHVRRAGRRERRRLFPVVVVASLAE
jgi:biopolymer transport protein ExbD